MNATQLTKFTQAREFARAIVNGSQESFNAFVASKAKTRALELANVLANTTDFDLQDSNGHEDSVKVAAILSLGVEMTAAYKSASTKTVKEVNTSDKAFRVRYEKLRMRYGEEKAAAIVADIAERAEKLLTVAKRS